MPTTEPLPPPVKPREKPVPQPLPAPPSKPQPDLDPFNPKWPATRPTPEPKAQVGK